jgi:hypothetical protein
VVPGPTHTYDIGAGIEGDSYYLTSEDTATLTVLAVPGEASHQSIPSEQMRASYNGWTGAVDVTYTPSCDTVNHAIYYGDLAEVSSYTYSGAECSVGVSGTASFDPGSGSVFFLIVGNNGQAEGSYGLNSAPEQRPEENSGICGLSQNLAGVVCE